MDSLQVRKRPRPVVSCLRCREKKLKCDRVAPCQNCTKAGGRVDCTYNQHPSSSDSLPNPKRVHVETNSHDDRRVSTLAPGPGIGIVEDLLQRVGHLEELLAVRPRADLRDASTVNEGHPVSRSRAPFPGTLMVKGSRSRYHGQNDRITLLNQFPGVKTFINRCVKDSTLKELAKEVQFLQLKSQLSTISAESLPDMETFPELLRNLSYSLPPKTVCDHLLRVYRNNFERTLRVIHEPSFRRQYDAFWSTSGRDQSELSSFVPLLTVLLTVAVALDPEPPAPVHTSSWEYLTSNATDLVQAWLSRLPRKQRIETSTLQVEVILLLSRQLRSASPEEVWKASGSLVRNAMVMGLHVNVSQSPKMTPFQAEIRRRLWVTIVEMDLQASLASGMPVMTPDVDFAPLMPANIDDADFDESSSQLPPSKPLTEYTDSLGLIVLASSLSQRIKAVNPAQHTHFNDDIGEHVAQGRELEKLFTRLPVWFMTSSELWCKNPAFVLNRITLDLFLRRPLLRLYRPVLAGHNSDDPAFEHTQRVCLDSYLQILSYQDIFDPSTTDFDVFYTSAYWDVFQTLFQNDVLWAALGVCEHMRLSEQLSTPSTPSDDSSSSLSSVSQDSSHNNTNLTRLVEHTLDRFTRRVGARGSNVKDILLLSLALQSSCVSSPVEEKERQMLRGAIEALLACRQRLLSAAADPSSPFILEGVPQMSNQPVDTASSSIQVPLIPTDPESDLPDFLQNSYALAAEFNHFQSNLFTFDDGSFMWNL